MTTIDTILAELKKVPSDRLDDLYSIIHSFVANKESSGIVHDDILSFAGSFGEMSENDYKEFLQHTENTRAKLFDRDVNV